MLRTITKDVGRYRVGQQHDYPLAVWRRIAQSAKLPLEKFSAPVENNPTHQSALRTRPTVHRRLGATQ